jgi:MoaA/NifB/PqqE/SkfB family radical SAM enzyme
MINTDGAKYLSIYLGNVCNFECSYCDRDYIKNTIGGQKMQASDVDDIINFIKLLVGEDGKYPLQMLNFHGGEPFVYVNLMDTILERMDELFPGSNFPFYIQTNGSLILGNEWFLEKWKDRLFVSISYDFLFQAENRTEFDIVSTIHALQNAGVTDVQFQFVIPIQERNAFSLDTVKSITDVCAKNGVKRINIIPLRHIRGKDKFRVIVDEIDLVAFFGAFTKFIELLYVMGMTVLIDGQEHDFDKHYFENHKQIILSPDGYIYPEYDFLEYKMYETVVGSWRKQTIIPIKLVRDNPDQETSLIPPMCISCESRDQCGLKFLYKEFDKTPQGNCKTFYQMLNIAIKHSQKLRQKPSLMHWIGI